MPAPGIFLLLKDCIRKSIIEQYACVRNEVKLNFDKIKSWSSNIPFACFVLDFYENPHSKSKFAAHRLYWIDNDKPKLTTRNLGEFAYNSYYSARKSMKASKLLVSFFLTPLFQTTQLVEAIY